MTDDLKCGWELLEEPLFGRQSARDRLPQWAYQNVRGMRSPEPVVSGNSRYGYIVRIPVMPVKMDRCNWEWIVPERHRLAVWILKVMGAPKALTTSEAERQETMLKALFNGELKSGVRDSSIVLWCDGVHVVVNDPDVATRLWSIVDKRGEESQHGPLDH